MTIAEGRRESAVLTPAQLTDPFRKVAAKLGSVIAEMFKAIGFEPYDKQLEILAHPAEVKMVTGGMQGGKTHMAPPYWLMKYILDLALHPPVPTEEREYWIAAHRIEDTNYEWNGLRRILKTLNLLKKEVKDPAPMFVLNDGPEGQETIIKAKFTSDVGKLSGVSPLGIIVCEAANVTKDAYEYLLGRTLGRAAWMYMSGTFEKDAHPWFAATFLEWSIYPNEADAKSFSLASYDNPHLFPKGKDDPKVAKLRSRHKSDKFFMERVEGVPAPPLGLVYPEFNKDLHLMLDYEFKLDQTLYIWHDPGFRHYTAILFAQWYGGTVYVFDEIYKRGLDTEAMIDIAKVRPWWKNDLKDLVSDPWYSDRQTAQSARTIDDIWAENAQLVNMGERHGIIERIDRVKSILRPNPETGAPQILFHAHRCQGLLSEFGIVGRPDSGELHPYKWDVDDDGYIKGKVPKDRNNDALDALGNGLMRLFGAARHPYHGNQQYGGVSTPETRGEYGSQQLQFDEWGYMPDDRDYAPLASTPESRGEAWY